MTVPTGVSNKEAMAETTDSGANAPTTAVIDDKAIAAWLHKHPLFFHQHADLLLELSIPHESGKAISLLERQVAVFRERQSTLQDQIHEFIGNARDNDNLFEKTRLVVLELLRCRNLDELHPVIAERLLTEFDASACALVFVADTAAAQHDKYRQLQTLDVKAALGDLFAKQRTYCGALNSRQQALLFPGQKKAIVSAAIVPLHLPETSSLRQRSGLPLLLIGSTEEQHFNSSLDTLFLDFIGEVLTAHLLNLTAAT